MDALSSITVNSSWMGPFEKANESVRIAISDENDTAFIYTSTLTITLLHMSDTGNYSCRAIISHMSDLIMSSETGIKEEIIDIKGKNTLYTCSDNDNDNDGIEWLNLHYVL